MSFVGNDLKYTLRKREFPFCARDALTKAEELLVPPNANSSRAHLLMQTELAMEVIAEFVFNDDERKGYRKKLTSLQELELMQVIGDHMMFDGTGNEASRNAMFLLLFPESLTDRVRLLVMLVSLAASTKNIPVLNAAGILMQQINSTSRYSSWFAQGLVNDHLLLVSKSSPCVLDIPKIAPLFSAHFLTATTEAYGFSEEKLMPPPKHLLEIIIQWLNENNTLCLSPLLNKLQPALPQGGIPIPATTPYAGLFRWCILSKLETDEELTVLYSKLHSMLLKSLVMAEQVNDRMANVVSAQNLASIVPNLSKVGQTVNSEHLNSAIDRLAETVQVAVESNTLYGPKQDLWRQLKTLPQTEPLKTVLEKHSN